MIEIRMGQRDIVSALWAVLSELVDGAEADVAWVLNPGDPGLLKSLDNLSAEQASAITTGGASIAAHVEHLRYGLELLNRWSRGGEPFSDADYAASWRLTAVSETEWASKRRPCEQKRMHGAKQSGGIATRANLRLSWPASLTSRII